MRSSKWQIIASTALVVAIFALLDALSRSDPSRVASHLAGIGVMLGLLPFMKWRLPRILQLAALAWLFGDVVFRNMFGPAAPIRTDAGAWRGVLALAYAAILMMIALYDRVIRRVQLQRTDDGIA